jgi:hypothetical protein
LISWSLEGSLRELRVRSPACGPRTGSSKKANVKMAAALDEAAEDKAAALEAAAREKAVALEAAAEEKEAAELEAAAQDKAAALDLEPATQRPPP